MRKDFSDKLIIIRSNSLEEQMAHFIERLKERYSISINEDEYNRLCDYREFHGAFSKNRRKTVGWVFIDNVKVLVLRYGERGVLATCYPPSVEYSNIEMIRSCFGGASKVAAIQVLRQYSIESAKVQKKKFSTDKEAALFIFTKTTFGNLHMDRHKKGAVSTIKVAAIINKILTGKSLYAEIVVKRKKHVPNGVESIKITED
jgi:uncharacterized protein YozE (UPF0346 family)